MRRGRGARVHFSFRSPYSWIAITRLLRRMPDAHQRLEFIPYWDPDPRTTADLAAVGAEFHYHQMSKAKHLYILGDTKRQAARLGLTMVWPIDDDPWWELPHLGWLLARRRGMGAEFYAAVMAARWERGEDICDGAAIRQIAEQLGIGGDEVVAGLDSDETRAEATGCLVAAYEDDIFGVPYFRVRRHRFWGLDRVDAFLAELSGVPSEEPADDPLIPVVADRGGYDTDTAGGCG